MKCPICGQDGKALFNTFTCITRLCLNYDRDTYLLITKENREKKQKYRAEYFKKLDAKKKQKGFKSNKVTITPPPLIYDDEDDNYPFDDFNFPYPFDDNT